MASNINDTNPFFVFTWTIRRFSIFGKPVPFVYSPSFTTFQNNSNEGQFNWRLVLREMDELASIGVCLCRLEDEKNECFLKCEMSLVNVDGLSMIAEDKSSIMGKISKLTFDTFVSRNRLFSNEKERLVPNDELTLRCKIWLKEAKPEKTGLCFAITDLLPEVDNFFWTIEEFTSLERGQVRSFLRKPNLPSVSPATLKLFLTGDKNIQIEATCQDPTDLETIWEVSILNALGQTGQTVVSVMETLDMEDIAERIISQMFMLDRTTKTPETEIKENILLSSKHKLIAQRDLALPNDVLILKFRCMKFFSGKILYDSRQTEKICDSDTDVQKHGTLTQDMQNLFLDGSFSDFNFLVGSQKFPVHKAVLSARSPVFKAMFTTEMKEKYQTSKELSDIDAKILQQLLRYIYTDTVKELQFEEAAALYSAADKYELISLKNVCSSILMTNICVSNVCEILVLSDRHSDDNLKRFAQDFIFHNGAEILRSAAWKNIRKHHAFLASETVEYMFLTRN